MKQSLQYQATDPSAILYAVRQIKNSAGAGFVVPSAIAYSEAGDLYVVDNNGQVIHRWKAGSNQVEVFLTQKAGAFNFPYAIQPANNKVYVSDNDGIKVFSANRTASSNYPKTKSGMRLMIRLRRTAGAVRR